MAVAVAGSYLPGDGEQRRVTDLGHVELVFVGGTSRAY